MLKSNLASSNKIGSISVLVSYTLMNQLASNLSILQAIGSSKAWLTNFERYSEELHFLTYFSRFFVVKSLASSKMLSPSINKCEASYRYNIPLRSS
ncbi:hypothetical protein OIU76_023809 [Salix suchowensis]|nr:hypothetical protein OIU76_023809 [Salix suchowensis]